MNCLRFNGGGRSASGSTVLTAKIDENVFVVGVLLQLGVVGVLVKRNFGIV